MNAKRILIIEDEGIIAEGLKLNLQKLGYEVAGIALNKNEFLEFASSDQEFDLALVDIMLGKRPEGFEVAKYLREQMGKPFIFATSYSDKDTLQKAKFLHPSGYMVKPFQKKDLLAAIEMVSLDEELSEEIKPTEFEKILEDALFYKDQHLLKKITIPNILYVQAFRNYIEVYETDKKHLIRHTLQAFLDKLPHNFIRIHKSYLVNINKITTVNSTYVLLDKTELPLSKNYKDTLVQLMNIL